MAAGKPRARMNSVRIAGAAALLIALGCPQGAIAQDYNYNLYGSWQNFSVPLDHRIMQETVMAETTRGSVSEATATSASMRLDFTPSTARRRTHYSRFIERSRRADPAGAASLVATLRSDPVAQMGPELARYGLRTDNVADAYTVYWVEAWQAAHNRHDSGSRAQAQAVKAQVTEALLATPQLVRATDA